MTGVILASISCNFAPKVSDNRVARRMEKMGRKFSRPMGHDGCERKSADVFRSENRAPTANFGDHVWQRHTLNVDFRQCSAVMPRYFTTRMSLALGRRGYHSLSPCRAVSSDTRPYYKYRYHGKANVLFFVQANGLDGCG